MARPKKDGKRAVGIQGKKGFLYIVAPHKELVNGEPKTTYPWRKTGLKDTPENISKAITLRNTLISENTDNYLDIDITVSECVELFLKFKKRDASDTTYAKYIYHAKLIKVYFGSIKARDLVKSQVEAFIDYLLGKKNLSLDYVREVKRTFSNCLEIAISGHVLSANPVKQATINKTLAQSSAKKHIEELEFLSFEEAKLFMAKVRNHPMREIFYFTLFFGLRRSEVLGLKWDCIDFEKGQMSIYHTVTKGTKINRNDIVKSQESARIYPLSEDQIEILYEVKEKESYNRKLFGRDYIENTYIFKKPDGSLYYPDSLTRSLKKIIERNPDLPQHITLHKLRTSCVSILVHMGYDIKSIQKWVGHADYDTTLRIYAKVKDSEAKKEISKGLSGLNLKNI